MFFPWLYDRSGIPVIYKALTQLLLRVEGTLSSYIRPSNNYCAMFDPLFATFLALLIIDSAHAQVNAPNCTDPTFTWVGYPWLVAHFQITNALSPLIHD
jgi:hypothetical protein